MKGIEVIGFAAFTFCMGVILGVPLGGLWDPGVALSEAQRELAENTAPVKENGIPVELQETWDKIAALEQRFDAHKTDIEGFCVAVARRGEVQMAVDAQQREDIARVERAWRDIATSDPHYDGPRPTPAERYVEARSVLKSDPSKRYVGVFNADGEPIIYAEVPESAAILATSICFQRGKAVQPPARLAP